MPTSPVMPATSQSLSSMVSGQAQDMHNELLLFSLTWCCIKVPKLLLEGQKLQFDVHKGCMGAATEAEES